MLNYGVFAESSIKQAKQASNNNPNYETNIKFPYPHKTSKRWEYGANCFPQPVKSVALTNEGEKELQSVKSFSLLTMI